MDYGASDHPEAAANGDTLTLATTKPPALSECSEAEEGANGVKEEAEGQAGLEQSSLGAQPLKDRKWRGQSPQRGALVFIPESL